MILDRRRAVLGSLAVAGAASWARRARAAETVEVQLDYVIRGNHAMFFVARERGYFAEEGIEVAAIRKGAGSVDAMRLVGNGNAAFGFGDLPTLAVARSQNVPVVALAAANPEYASKIGVLEEQLAADIEATFTSPETRAHGLGWMSEERWSATVRVLLDQGAMKTPIEVAKAFDVSFLAA